MKKKLILIIILLLLLLLLLLSIGDNNSVNYSVPRFADKKFKRSNEVIYFGSNNEFYYNDKRFKTCNKYRYNAESKEIELICRNYNLKVMVSSYLGNSLILIFDDELRYFSEE